MEVLDTSQFTLEKNLKEYDLILHRDSGVSFDDIDLLILRSLAPFSKQQVNSHEVIESLRGKDKQALFFQEHKLPFIPTSLFRGAAQGTDSFPNIEEFVLKTIRGNQGRGVMLIRGHDSLASILEANEARKDERYILQPKMTFLKEYRVLCLDQEVWGAIEKDFDSDFRANAKRCQPKEVEALPEEVLRLSQSILKILPKQFLGLDIAMTENGPLIIEINTTPGFEVFDKLHEINSATRLLQELL
ncbi:MAG: ribosomal protein S6--L-glutamate ligase [Bacteriovoracaceae bacterium]|jgi:ribosomal protein S6--L-glutamate ligase